MERLLGTLKENHELWDLFTRKEEYSPTFLDGHGRFPYYMSKHKNIFVPEVSRFLLENGLRVEYPEGRRFAVCLTHDIDFVYLPRLRIAANAIRSFSRGNVIGGFKTLLSNSVKRWNPFWNFHSILALEESYGAKSTFYFLSASERSMDFNFALADVEGDIRDIVARGWEVGLHGGYHSCFDIHRINEEKSRLEGVAGRDVVGCRNHYLRFKVPDSWELLSEAGFKYDTTLGYAGCAGFRNGMCHPFKPVNLNTGKEIDILEIPLTVMDGTLFESMALDGERAWEITKLMVDVAEKHKGVVTVLWHNNYLVGDSLKMYEKLLKYCKEKSAWLTSGEEIYQWWRELGHG